MQIAQRIPPASGINYAAKRQNSGSSGWTGDIMETGEDKCHAEEHILASLKESACCLGYGPRSGMPSVVAAYGSHARQFGPQFDVGK